VSDRPPHNFSPILQNAQSRPIPYQPPQPTTFQRQPPTACPPPAGTPHERPAAFGYDLPARRPATGELHDGGVLPQQVGGGRWIRGSEFCLLALKDYAGVGHGLGVSRASRLTSLAPTQEPFLTWRPLRDQAALRSHCRLRTCIHPSCWLSLSRSAGATRKTALSRPRLYRCERAL
jgi:hypothetical protein